MNQFWIVLLIIIFLILFIRAITATSNKNKKSYYFDAVGKVKEKSNGFGFGEFLLYFLLLDFLFRMDDSDEPYNSYEELNSGFFEEESNMPWENNQDESNIDYFDTFLEEEEDDILEFENDFFEIDDYDDGFDGGWGDE